MKLSVVKGVAIGKNDAPVTMIEFTDYQCPFCRQYHTSTFDEIQKNFIDTGKVRYISRDYPLPIHQNAIKAANAARCAGEQNRFWQFRHVLIVNSDKLTRNDILAYAKDLQLNTGQFTVCLDSDKYQADVQRDISDGTSVGVSGTPQHLYWEERRTTAGWRASRL